MYIELRLRLRDDISRDRALEMGEEFKDKFYDAIDYDSPIRDVTYEVVETGLCPVCSTLWNTHTEHELESCRTEIKSW
jgi:hypothetical protein